jgi:hypothetical protein
VAYRFPQVAPRDLYHVPDPNLQFRAAGAARRGCRQRIPEVGINLANAGRQGVRKLYAAFFETTFIRAHPQGLVDPSETELTVARALVVPLSLDR